ncbi:sigma-70 family RNA polymerase sigma factor [bacterium]|nr:sigma-70 family RNA polymerase sigma factor [bacterium]
MKKIDSEEPDKKYLSIYTMRYDKGMTQKEISAELNVSQSEISKRLYCLLEKVRSVLN